MINSSSGSCYDSDATWQEIGASCEKSYIGETGRKFGTRLKEHKTEVEPQLAKLLPETSVHQVCLSRTNQH